MNSKESNYQSTRENCHCEEGDEQGEERKSPLNEVTQHKAILQMYRNSKEINLAKLNSRISVEVLTLPVSTEPTLRATVHVQFSSHCTT